MLQQERSGSVVMTIPAVSLLADQVLHAPLASTAPRTITAQSNVTQLQLTLSA